MKNQKKLLVVISKFPKILYTITRTLNDENVDFILDASDFSRPASLLRIANPDVLVLNVALTSKKAIELVMENVSGNMDMKKGMVTTNLGIYYMSLCSTFGSNYVIDKFMDLELIPRTVSKQQLN